MLKEVKYFWKVMKKHKKKQLKNDKGLNKAKKS